MNRMLVLFAIVATTLGTQTVPRAALARRVTAPVSQLWMAERRSREEATETTSVQRGGQAMMRLHRASTITALCVLKNSGY